VPPWWYGPWAGTERMRRANVREIDRKHALYEEGLRQSMIEARTAVPYQLGTYGLTPPHLAPWNAPGRANF